MKDKRVVFMGTPEFSVPILEMLICETNVVMVVCQKDALVGRKKVLTAPPIKKLAMQHNIEVYQPLKIRNEFSHILECNPDIIITCAYGQIIPDELLFTPKYKAINVHASLLPKLRGGAPIHRAIINGFTQTGITIMYMAPGMDDGDIIAQRSIEINDTDNTGILHDKLSVLGRDLLLETLPSIFDGTNDRIRQNEEEVSFAKIIKREDELITFDKTSIEVYNHIRGLYPFPGGYVMIDNEILKLCESRINNIDVSGEVGEITNIHEDGFGVKTIDGEIIITKVKPAGKNEMLCKDYINGKRKENLLGRKLC